MSPTCGVDIVLQSSEHTRRDILLLLINSGWSATGWGGIAYRPLGNIDDVDWQSRPAAAWPEVLAILEQKQAAGETLSLELHWQGGEEGGSFHVDADPHYPWAAGVDRVVAAPTMPRSADVAHGSHLVPAPPAAALARCRHLCGRRHL